MSSHMQAKPKRVVASPVREDVCKEAGGSASCDVSTRGTAKPLRGHKCRGEWRGAATDKVRRYAPVPSRAVLAPGAPFFTLELTSTTTPISAVREERDRRFEMISFGQRAAAFGARGDWPDPRCHHVHLPSQRAVGSSADGLRIVRGQLTSCRLPCTERGSISCACTGGCGRA